MKKNQLPKTTKKSPCIVIPPLLVIGPLLAYFYYLELYCDKSLLSAIIWTIPISISLFALFASKDASLDSTREMEKINQKLEELISVTKGSQSKTAISKKKKHRK